MPPITAEDVLRNALQEQMRRETQDPALTLNFQTGKLNQHVPTDTRARFAVLQATIGAADEFGFVLNGKGRGIVLQSVSRDTRYSAAVEIMETAIGQGATPKPA